MTITKIERLENKDKHYAIFIDDRFVFVLKDVDVRHYKLEEQTEMQDEQFRYIMDNAIFAKARDRAFRYLGIKARTEMEVWRKLEEEQYADEIINRVMTLLKHYDYINDEKYAVDYVKERVEYRGFGIIRIKQELKQKGINTKTINKAFEQVEMDAFEINELQMALDHLRKKNRGNYTLDEKEKKRCIDYLLRRGFSFDVVKQALSRYIKENAGRHDW